MTSERNFLDHIQVLVRWRRLILTCFLVVALVTAIISLLLPKAYRAYAIVYPPQDAQGGMGLSALIGNLQSGLMGSLGDVAVSATEFVPVIESARVRLEVAKRFGLTEHYGAQHRSELLDIMADHLRVELTREQFLSVSYEAETPQLAADITNAFVEALESAIQERNKRQKHIYRTYLEKRLHQAERDMLNAETRYNDFQNKNMVIDIEAQAKAQIESASNMISGLVDLILQRDIASQMMAGDNPRLKQLDIEIQTTSRALDQLLMGDTADLESRSGVKLPGIFKPFHEIPKLGLTALQLMRDVEIQNAIYQFVKQEYEKTRFEEEKETSTVIVLDRAVPPDVRSAPRRTMMVAIAGGLSLILSSILAFVFESMRNLTPENRAKIEAIGDDLRRKKDERS